MTDREQNILTIVQMCAEARWILMAAIMLTTFIIRTSTKALKPTFMKCLSN